MKIFLVAVALLVAIPVQAQVWINEIAWMGTQASSADEWIELYNSGTSTVALDEWTLGATDGTPDITLSGTIEADGFYLLERTDDTVVSDIEADLIYSGGLSNAGEHLQLRNASGTIVDSVSEWSGGDSELFASMERGTDGWHTNELPSANLDAEGNIIFGTPRATNSSTVSSEDSQEQESNDSSDATSTPEIADTPKGASIVILINNEERDIDELTIGQSQTITVRGSGDTADSYKWNLGNGSLAIGEEVEIAYQFAGQFLLTLEARFGTQTIIDQLKIQVFPTSITISEFMPDPIEGDTENEWIELHNSSEMMIDIGGFLLDDEEGGSKPFAIPERTYIFPKSYLVLPRPQTKLSLNNDSDEVRLLMPDGTAISRISYDDAKQGFVGVFMDTEGFVWSSKPTPGFANVVNPNNAVSSTIEQEFSVEETHTSTTTTTSHQGSSVQTQPIITKTLSIQSVHAVENDPRDRLVLIEKGGKIGHTVQYTDELLAQASTASEPSKSGKSANTTTTAQLKAAQRTAGVSFVIVGILILSGTGIGLFKKRPP